MLLVLDEADRLLEGGFDADLAAVLRALPRRLQTASFSATYPPALRERLPVGRGSATIQRADRELKTRLDVWSQIGDGLRVMQEVKRRFDPTGTLNPGRGPGGL